MSIDRFENMKCCSVEYSMKGSEGDGYYLRLCDRHAETLKPPAKPASMMGDEASSISDELLREAAELFRKTTPAPLLFLKGSYNEHALRVALELAFSQGMRRAAELIRSTYPPEWANDAPKFEKFMDARDFFAQAIDKEASGGK